MIKTKAQKIAEIKSDILILQTMGNHIENWAQSKTVLGYATAARNFMMMEKFGKARTALRLGKSAARF